MGEREPDKPVRYATQSIFEMREWAIARLHAGDGRPEVGDIYEWSRSWLENDPREGGDPWQRRELRKDWAVVRADYLRLRG